MATQTAQKHLAIYFLQNALFLLHFRPIAFQKYIDKSIYKNEI